MQLDRRAGSRRRIQFSCSITVTPLICQLTTPCHAKGLVHYGHLTFSVTGRSFYNLLPGIIIVIIFIIKFLVRQGVK